MIHIYYTDGSEQHHGTLAEAEQGIEENILGCDFAVGVESVSDDQGNNYGCTWSVSLAPQ